MLFCGSRDVTLWVKRCHFVGIKMSLCGSRDIIFLGLEMSFCGSRDVIL